MSRLGDDGAITRMFYWILLMIVLGGLFNGIRARLDAICASIPACEAPNDED